jgi:hypothetical protein
MSLQTKKVSLNVTHLVTNQGNSLPLPQVPQHVGQRHFLEFAGQRPIGPLLDALHHFGDSSAHRAFRRRFVGMRGKGIALIHRVMDFAQGYFFGFALEQRTPMGPSQSGNQACLLQLDQESSNHHGIGIHGLGQTRGGTAICLLQCQDRHHMHRKSKSAALHP